MDKPNRLRAKKWHIFFVILAILVGFATRQKMESDFTKGRDESTWRAQYEKDDQYYREMSQKILNPQFDFSGIELVFVGPGPRYFSRWGHLFLRFVQSALTPEQDLTVSFLVDANEFNVDNWGGFFGGKYSIYPLIKTVQDHTKDYYEGEQRTLTAYPVAINDEQKEKLKTVLRDWINDRKLMGTWAFYDNNCTSLMDRYLSEAGIIDFVPLGLLLTPKDFKEALTQKGLLIKSIPYQGKWY